MQMINPPPKRCAWASLHHACLEPTSSSASASNTASRAALAAFDVLLLLLRTRTKEGNDDTIPCEATTLILTAASLMRLLTKNSFKS